MAGVFIRVLGDKFPWPVKVAILQAMTKMLDRNAPAVRAFQPQMQTSFVKCLSDATAKVRDLAARALPKLMPIAVRVDPVVTELCNTLPAATEPVQESVLQALAGVAFRAGDRITPPVRAKAVEAAAPLRESEDGDVRLAAAAALGALARHADADTVVRIVQPCCFTPADVKAGMKGAATVEEDPLRDGRASTVIGALKYAPAAVLPLLPSHIVPHLLAVAGDDSIVLRERAATGLGWALSHAGRAPPVAPAGAVAGGAGSALPPAAPAGAVVSAKAPDASDFAGDVPAAYRAHVAILLPVLTRLTSDDHPDVRQTALNGLKRFAKWGWAAAAPAAPTVSGTPLQ